MNTVVVLAVLLSSFVPSGAEDMALVDVLSPGEPLADLFSDPDTYMTIMKPLLYANYLTYKTYPGPRLDGFISVTSATIPAEYGGLPSTSPGPAWERMHNLEKEREKGPHMRTFLLRSSALAIVAFRGACFDELVPGCQSDMHMGQDGNPTIEDYIRMASQDLLMVQTGLGPSIQVLVTGHQLGAFLAAQACEHSPQPCAVASLSGITHTMKPPPLKKLTHDKYFRFYDPIDLEVHPSARNFATFGQSTVCTYDGLQPPLSCSACSGAVPLGQAAEYAPSIQEFTDLVACRKGEVPTGHYKTQCFDDTNWLDHWVERILPSGIMPECTAYDASNPNGIVVIKKSIEPVASEDGPQTGSDSEAGSGSEAGKKKGWFSKAVDTVSNTVSKAVDTAVEATAGTFKRLRRRRT